MGLVVRLPAVALLGVVAAVGCTGRNEIDRPTGAAVARAQIGPGGGVVRGGGGTALEGVELTLPAGALGELVEIVIEPGAELPWDGTVAAGLGLRISATPNPGPLFAPAFLRLPVDVPDFRVAADVVVVGRGSVPAPDRTETRRRDLVVANEAVIDRDSDRATVPIQALCDLQPRLTTVPRRIDDAGRLVVAALEALERRSDGGLTDADLLLAEARRADPFSVTAPLFRAATRILTVLNDDADVGPGLDSVGEALRRFGFDLAGGSLWRRLVTGEWPGAWTVPAGAPSSTEVVELLRRRVRPVLELALADLDALPAVAVVLFELPLLAPWLPGERELDVTDVQILRGALAAAIAAIDTAEDLDLDVDWPAAFGAGPRATLQQLLAAHPALLSRRSPVEERTARAALALVTALDGGLRSLLAETDPQDNDVFVLGSQVTPVTTDRWRGNLAALRAGLERSAPGRLRLPGEDPLTVALWLVFGLDATFDPRPLLPAFRGDRAIGGTFPDPEFAGVLRGLRAEQITRLLALPNLHAAPPIDPRIDGRLIEWPAAGAALRPADDAGDAVGPAGFGVDLRQVWLAVTADRRLAAAITVHDGAIAYRPGRRNRYRIVIADDLEPPAGRQEAVLDIELTGIGPRLAASRDGVPLKLRQAVAVGADGLELTVDLDGLLQTDPRERRISVEATDLELSSLAETRDRTRVILTVL